MLKKAAAITGGVIMLPPLGAAVMSCGVPGLLVAGAGLFLANTMMKGQRTTERQFGMDGKQVDGLEGQLRDPFASSAQL